MLIEDQRFGAMNLYRRKPGTLSDGEMASGRVFADMATAYLFGPADLLAEGAPPTGGGG